jgi:transcriptional regulatory protein LevR/transcriptional regulator with AAA-type ATPase domain
VAKKIDDVLNAVRELENINRQAVTANEVSEFMKLDRANVSRYLNKLYKDKELEKLDGRPVRYSLGDRLNEVEEQSGQKNYVESFAPALEVEEENSLDSLVGANSSLQVAIQQAKAAILYPPNGLHTIILGETGVGKSMFAEAMYGFAKDANVLKDKAPFIRFNCADYADNPQLVMAQIFGVKRGAFTGADKDKDGLLKKADGGILFLDEIHRLSPQGQEMLFTFIDKGVFRPLGETETQISVKLQIIAATTEDPKSYLLQTFTRRIPMTIILPPLRERSLSERYDLLDAFIKDESARLGEPVYFNRNALSSFVLYDCNNNIGQLKSDIQLSCAKAFLNYKSGKKNIIVVEQSDLQSSVKRGIMKLQDKRSEIDKMFNTIGDVVCFSNNEVNNFLDTDLVVHNNDEEHVEHFYLTIENKLKKLKKQGLTNNEIDDILNLDIEGYFRKYISELKGTFRKDEISKIVDKRVVDVVEEALGYAAKELGREFGEKVYFGLALHLQGSIERIINGNEIYHPKLNKVRKEYRKEFMVAMEIAKLIEDKFEIAISLDEIGYITMFLATDADKFEKKNEEKVAVLVIMHGRATATSMVEVANTFIGDEYVQALDMPLDMKAEIMFEKVKHKVKEMNTGRGVIILADMGSLVNFGDIIKEETGVNIKTVDMVSTLAVIEAGRKALNGRDLTSIYESCSDISKFGLRYVVEKEQRKNLCIVTTCFTGEGSAARLKKFIEEKLVNIERVNVIPMNILEREKFIESLSEVRAENKVLAIVGTVDMDVENIPFVSGAEIFTGEGLIKLNKMVKREIDYDQIAESLKTQIKDIDSYELVHNIRLAIGDMENNLELVIDDDAKMGMLMHMGFLVDKIKKGRKETLFVNLNEYRAKNSKAFIMVKQSLKLVEREYKVSIGENEIAFIVKMILNNSIFK